MTEANCFKHFKGVIYYRNKKASLEANVPYGCMGAEATTV
jgi:hypothetical protein